ncbi:MAG: hypothetical protein EON60_06535 [Alphaproteobacteria bacterium]|nr:MAG: hypothetical protein EON60_06535 [Alphaproteobacteria bacterium]
MADTRTLRQQLQTYGTNGGILLTEEEFVDLVLAETTNFSAKARVRLMNGMSDDNHAKNVAFLEKHGDSAGAPATQ